MNEWMDGWMRVSVRFHNIIFMLIFAELLEAFGALEAGFNPTRDSIKYCT
jgi:hypothetical protein